VPRVLARWSLCWRDCRLATAHHRLEGVTDVAASRALHPCAHIGPVVDKFQGQEAPIVFYSVTTSSQADAPREMEFLYSANRLNAATSRTKCPCVLVSAPTLFE
jgi:hypothetical protein